MNSPFNRNPYGRLVSVESETTTFKSDMYTLMPSANLLDPSAAVEHMIPNNWAGQTYNQLSASADNWTSGVITVEDDNDYYLVNEELKTINPFYAMCYKEDGTYLKQIATSGSDSISPTGLVNKFTLTDSNYKIGYVRFKTKEVTARVNPFLGLDFKKKTTGVLLTHEPYGSNTYESKIVDLDKCNLLLKKGTYYSTFTTSGSSSATVKDASYEYKRNNTISKKVTLAASNSDSFSLIWDIDGAVNNIGVFLSTTYENLVKIAAEPLTCTLYVCRDLDYANSYSATPSASLTPGWGFYKYPLSEMTVNGTAPTNPNKAVLTFTRGATNTAAIEIIVNGIIVDSYMRSVIMVNHDGTYSTDIEENGKYATEELYNIPFTVFTNGTIESTSSSKLFELVGKGLADLGQYACADNGTILAKYPSLSEIKEAFYDETTVTEPDQYTLLNDTHNAIKPLSGYPINYAAPQGKLTNMTMRALKRLGIKSARVTGWRYIGYFSKHDFAFGSVSLYTSSNTTTIKSYIDKAISSGMCISLFTHTVTDAGETYGCTKAQFAEILAYIAAKRDLGLCDVMTKRQFVEACY